MIKITAIIITKNEELHIERCISSINNEVDKIVVIDSGSNDNTQKICKNMGVDFYFNEWKGFSNQINWAINKVESFSDWIIRIDADEILEKNSIPLKKFLNDLNKSVNGINIKRNIFFNKSLIKYGGIHNKEILRIFRSGFGKCDEKDMDEHILVIPKILDSDYVISDISLIDFNQYIIKHLHYAHLEVSSKNSSQSYKQNNLTYSKSTLINKFLKKYLYEKIPPKFRPFLYFFYRMIVRRGIFENTDGFYFHLFQGLMYRSFVEYIRYKECSKKQ